VPQPRLTAPRNRLAFLVGWFLLTLVSAASIGYAIWRATESDFNLESPEQARSMSAVQETATALPTSRVMRLKPDTPTAMPTERTDVAPTPIRERASNILSVVTDPNSSPERTATTPAGSPELITNGSFEEGTSAWYIEGGAGPVSGTSPEDGTTVLLIPAGGGYADQIVAVVPGETYQLRGSGRMTGEGDTGLLGVIYRDGSGSRLRRLKPASITFTETTFTEKLLVFTVPEGVADVYVYLYKEPGSAQFEADEISVQRIGNS
jgi:hypothetical protein